MAKTALNGRNYSHGSTKQTPNVKPTDASCHQTSKSPLEPGSLSTVPRSMPSQQATAFCDLSKSLVSTFNDLHGRSTSPAPSDDYLEKLDDLRLNIGTDEKRCNNYGVSGNWHPLIDCKHLLEVEDTKHRYGTYLLPYYDIWRDSGSTKGFFTWLDEGEGRNVDSSKWFAARPHCVPRADLEEAMVHYCTEEERKQYEVLVENGKLVWASGKVQNRGRKKNPVVDTGNGEERWIFVIDEHGHFFLNKKAKGRFHHSSFVAGRPVRAAGRIIVRNGDIEGIGPNSGHYLTSLELLLRAIEEFFGSGVEELSALCARSSFEMDRCQK